MYMKLFGFLFSVLSPPSSKKCGPGIVTSFGYCLSSLKDG